MKRFIYFLLAVGLVMLNQACQDTAKKTDSKNDNISTEIESPPDSIVGETEYQPADSESLIIEEREPDDDEIREFGKIAKIEDGPYPMFIVTMEFPERQITADFNLNIEAVTLDVENLMDLSGQYVNIYYTSEIENLLQDLRLNNQSLYGEYAPEEDPTWNAITGILEGAETETAGDLPDEISVTSDEGKKMIFDEYITAEIVKANGLIVTAFYYERGIETITYLQPSEN